MYVSVTENLVCLQIILCSVVEKTKHTIRLLEQLWIQSYTLRSFNR